MPPRWTRSPSLLIFLACLALYSVNGREISEIDCDIAPYTAWSLARHATFDVARYAVPRDMQSTGVLVTARNGALLSKYPPGSAIAALPVVAPLALVQESPIERRSRMRRLGKFIASLYVAGTVVLIYLMCRRLAPAGALVATLLAASGTTLWSTASQGYWAHGPAAFFLALGCLSLLKIRESGESGEICTALVAGLSLGFALLIRPTTGVFAAASILALASNRRWIATGIVTTACSLAGVLLLAYNQHYFGNWLAGGYLSESNSWPTPLRVGLPGLLIAPSRGLLVYSPAFLLLPFAGASLRTGSRLSGYERALVIAWLAASIATLFVYARWHMWWGGWSFGPRFLSEAVPVLALTFALAWQNLSARLGVFGRRVGWTLIWLSVTVHFIGVFGYHTEWNASHGAADLFALTDTQIGARAQKLLVDRPQALALPLFAIAVAILRRRLRKANRPIAADRRES
jgi:hypothetical protein